MFCHKCGTQLPDDLSFCHKCGAKMAHADTTQQTSYTATPSIVETAQELHQDFHMKDDGSSKVKSKKPIFKIAGIAVAVFIIIVVVLSGNSVDYVETAKNMRPNGYSLTYGEVFNEYISSAKWEVTERSKELVFIDIIGTIPTTQDIRQKSDIIITLKITPYEEGRSEDMVLVGVDSIEMYGITYQDFSEQEDFSASWVVTDFFDAYELGYSNIAQYFNDIGFYQYNT